jgi:arylsulfatase A-like enzyme
VTVNAGANLLFVFGDEHRADSVGCAGNVDIETPVVDALASAGLRLTRAFANSPACTPSRGSMITGCYPQRHLALANDLPIDPSCPSIARSLRAAGYDCGYIGKWHLGGVPRDRFIPPGPERLGFDNYWASWNCHHDYFHPKWHEDSPVVRSADGRYEPEVQTDLALAWLETRQAQGRTNPFCLFVSYGPPHRPYRPLPPGFAGRYDPRALTLRPNCRESDEVRRDLADYYAHISALDEQLGRLLKFLTASAVADCTLVVFSSDHGTMMGSHGLHWKQWPYDEAIGIPLLLRFGDRFPGGSTREAPIGLVDLAPTLLGLLQVPPTGAMDGVDRAAELLGLASTSPESVVYLQEATAKGVEAVQQGILPWRGLRTAQHTYAENIDGPWLLYDNNEDPFQLRNLIGEERLAAEFHDSLALLMQSTGDALEPAVQLIARLGLTDAWNARQRQMASLIGRRDRLPGED